LKETKTDSLSYLSGKWRKDERMELRPKSSYRIIQLIYKAALEDYMEKFEEAKNPNIIYVTDLVACTHKFHMRHAFPELTLKFEPAAIMGDLLHAGLEALLEKEGFQIEVPIEKKISLNGKDYIVKGRLDAYKDDEKLPVEIKSGRSAANLPREHHVLQVQVYLDILNANKGILIYITPDRIIEYDIQRDKSVNVKSLVKALLEDSIHPKWDWECKYCPFQKICPYYYNKYNHA
jgi:CRISPR-associated exonuclease Cas4